MEEGVVDETRVKLEDLAGPVASPLSPSGARPTGLHVSFKVPDTKKVKWALSMRCCRGTRAINMHTALSHRPHMLPGYNLQDLTYTVHISPPKGGGGFCRKVPLKLLDRVTAHFQPGEMTALMGPSGCGESMGSNVGCRSGIRMLKAVPSYQSGKTTLMDVISGRKTSGDIEGDILFGISKASKSFLSRNTGQYICTLVQQVADCYDRPENSILNDLLPGYVEQFDTLADNLTVREMLKYTALMKLPTQKPKAEKYDAVERIIVKLNLEKCR
jgi:ABC-type glutathione transport system ATPase component